MWNTMANVVRDYEKIGKRNRKKDDQHLNKHAMHLIRLFLMALDILEKGEINTCREKEHELLMDIRQGKFQKEDGTFDEGFDFIVVNFANGDMVGHTGDIDAATKAVEAVDSCLGKIIQKASANGYEYIQISDHGNCEALRSASGEMLTNHTTFDVFCFVLCSDGRSLEMASDAGLANVAPSVLKLMELEIPKEMENRRKAERQ